MATVFIHLKHRVDFLAGIGQAPAAGVEREFRQRKAVPHGIHQNMPAAAHVDRAAQGFCYFRRGHALAQAQKIIGKNGFERDGPEHVPVHFHFLPGKGIGVQGVHEIDFQARAVHDVIHGAWQLADDLRGFASPCSPAGPSPGEQSNLRTRTI